MTLTKVASLDFGSRWDRIRADVLERDHRRCHECGRPATQVDHVRSVTDGGEVYSPANIAAYCASCLRRRMANRARNFRVLAP